MNSGPGGIAGMFVHERHGKVEYPENGAPVFRPRLSGWYGGDQVGRFNMDNKFRPSPGASGYQVSNPSVIDLTSFCASLSVFNETNMEDLRKKSVSITAYLEHLLLSTSIEGERAFKIITPSDPAARGTQLSVLLKPGRLETLSSMLEEAGIICDKRKPDVIRVAPVPLYNTYEEVWEFVQIFNAALQKCE
jgi:kynureninase